MKNQTTEDLRVRRTVGAIRTAFRQMMCEMDYENITVKALADRAQINRKTFYLHYSKLDDLFNELREEITGEYLKRTQSYKLPGDLKIFVREFFLQTTQSGALGERLIVAGRESYFLNRIKNELERRSWIQAEETDEYAIHRHNLIVEYVSQCLFTVYRQWLKNGKTIPLGDMIELTVALICDGTNGFMRLNQNN